MRACLSVCVCVGGGGGGGGGGQCNSGCLASCDAYNIYKLLVIIVIVSSCAVSKWVNFIYIYIYDFCILR